MRQRLPSWFQRQQPTSGGTVRSSRPANCCQHIPLKTVSSTVFRIRVSLQRLSWIITHQKPQRPSDFSRSWLRIPLSGDVHQNPGPTTKYPCPVCARNVTGRGMSYLCNRCSGWVHSKCSGLQNAAEYRRIKDWVCSPCSSPPTHSTETTTTTNINSSTSCRWEFIHHHAIQRKWHRQQTDGIRWINVKVAMIQETTLSSNSKTPSIQNFSTVRKDRRKGQGGVLLTLIHKSINFSRKHESPETLVEPHLEEMTITAMLRDREVIITNVYIPRQAPAQEVTFLPWSIWWWRRTP